MEKHATDTKDRLIRHAFELFSKVGYENATIERIINAAGCSKGTFYHYFSGKEELLVSWHYKLDVEYMDWFQSVPDETNSLEKLQEYNKMLLDKMEFHSDLESISVLYASQLNLRDERLIARSNKNYHEILSQILKTGQMRGEIRDDISFVELAKMYTSVFRGIVYEWCISGGSYSLREFGVRTMHLLVRGFAKEADESLRNKE